MLAGPSCDLLEVGEEGILVSLVSAAATTGSPVSPSMSMPAWYELTSPPYERRVPKYEVYGPFTGHRKSSVQRMSGVKVAHTSPMS